MISPVHFFLMVSSSAHLLLLLLQVWDQLWFTAVSSAACLCKSFNPAIFPNVASESVLCSASSSRCCIPRVPSNQTHMAHYLVWSALQLFIGFGYKAFLHVAVKEHCVCVSQQDCTQIKVKWVSANDKYNPCLLRCIVKFFLPGETPTSLCTCTVRLGWSWNRK